jgi:hypothetical protein
LIDALAAHAQLPPWMLTGQTYPAAIWLEGQVMQESSGDPRARRYEGLLDLVPDGDTRGVDDAIWEDDASYGLLQVLGSNLRAMVGVPLGTRMSFDFALRPAAGLVFGVRHLVDECLKPVAGDVPRALARYNGGLGGSLEVSKNGTLVLRRQDYVDAVAAWTRRVAQEQLA